MQTTIRSMLTLVFATVAFTALANDRPNFVVFIADDMAWNDCGAYGHPNIRTPNMDQLAKEGMRFDRAYLTCSSCSPSRCSILTGRYPHSTGAGELHLPLPGDQTMLTKPLKQSGYWTAAVGKWHLGEKVANQVDYRKSSSPQKMGEAWVQAIKDRPKDKPFFLWAAHSDPHRGYKPGAVDPPHEAKDVVVPPFLPDTHEVRRDLALYYDEVSRFDEHIGMALEELDQQKVADDTLIIVISDNGRPFPYCKTMVHVPGVRTPFIVRWPNKIATAQVSNSVISTVDIAPTLLDFAGVEIPDSFQGSSLRPAFLDPKATVRTFAYAEHNWHDYKAYERAIHSSNFCYVRNWLPNTPGTPPADAVKSATFASMKKLRAGGKLDALMERTTFATPRETEFLFDVRTDPACIRNLAADSTHQSTLAKMRGELERWQIEFQDEFPGDDKITPDGFDRKTGNRMIKKSHPSFQ